ncbi:26344_t:CDS:1, partial [Racocetra persica]
NLTEKQEKYLEKEYTKLEKITKKPREYHIKEALIRYMLHMEQDIKKPEIRKEIEKIMAKRELPDRHIAVALFGYIDGGY